MSAFNRALDEKLLEVAAAVENGENHVLVICDAEHQPVGALDNLPVLEETDIVELWDLTTSAQPTHARCFRTTWRTFEVPGGSVTNFTRPR